MSRATMAAVQARISAGLPAEWVAVGVFALDAPPASPSAPHYVVGAPTPDPPVQGRCVSNHGRQAVDRWRVMVVSDTSEGASTLQLWAVEQLDGWTMGGPWRVEYTTAPQRDREDPTRWHWTATIEALHTRGRNG
jgi:hypothetical protein